MSLHRFTSPLRVLKLRARAALRPETPLWKALRYAYNALPTALKREAPSVDIPQMLADFADNTREVFFIQIGACDGVRTDPIHQYIVRDGWSGVLVEPVGYLFKRLQATYAGMEQLTLVNAAIAATNETRAFWFLRASEDAELPEYYDELGSFYPDVVRKHAASIPNLEHYLVSEDVRCLTLNTLLRDHGVTRIDLMLIDTEGYDFEVIKLIDFTHDRPTRILYEHKHLSDSDREQCLRLLRREGYTIGQDGQDTLAY